MKTRTLLLALLAASSYAQTGTFSATGNMTTPGRGHGYSATLLPNGKVLIAGGGNASGFLASAELYDPSAGIFTATGNMITPRGAHSATLLPNGNVLIAGGGTWGGKPLASAELYDPSTGKFTATADMVTGAGGATAILLANGKVLVLITHPRFGGGPGAAEIYDPLTGTFSATGDPIWGGGLRQAALLADGRVYFSCCDPEELYDPASGTFSLTGARTRVYATDYAAALLPNGKVLLSGGYSERNDIVTDNDITDGAELYDPSTGASSATADMTMRRFGHTATLLGDGTVMIAGGYSSPFSSGLSPNAEIYDPDTGAFSRTGEMTVARGYHKATLLNDGSVLITGLRDDGRAERYTPAVPVPAPVLFSLSGDGRGQGAIWHGATGQVASADNPAIAGETLSMYTTSFVEGGVIPPQVAVGGRLADISYFGAAPGYPGYYQVNFVVPVGVPPGPDVSVCLTYIGRSSNAVSIGVQ
jgi:galactose oxidase-like protein